jgi:hypothetical protein
MTDTISIPLNKLLAWDGNVRKTDTGKGIDELAASIYAPPDAGTPLVRIRGGGHEQS